MGSKYIDVFSYFRRVFSAYIYLKIVCIIVCQNNFVAQTFIFIVLYSTRENVQMHSYISGGIHTTNKIKEDCAQSSSRVDYWFVEILYPHQKLPLISKSSLRVECVLGEWREHP